MAETPKNSKPSKRTESWWSKNWFYITLVLVAVIGGGCAFTLPYQFQREGDNIWSLRQAILAATGGVLAILTLWENRRKNIQEKEKNDQDHTRQVHAERRARYAKAIEQLADDKSAIRLGGVYTLAKLVDEWLADEKTLPSEEERRQEGQIIIDSLCAYIRSSFLLAERHEEYSSDYEDYKKKCQNNKIKIYIPQSYKNSIKDFSFGYKNSKYNNQPIQSREEFVRDKSLFQEEQEVRKTILSEIKNRLNGGKDKNEYGKDEVKPGTWSYFEYDFSNAVFFYDFNLKEVNFIQQTDFSETIFHAVIDFSRADFHGEGVTFSGAHFHKDTTFSEAHFSKKVDFSRAHFHKSAEFSKVIFHKGASFSGAQFSKDSSQFFESADFSGADFHESADFSGADFHESADFSKVIFHNEASFSGAHFHKKANFSGAQFSKDSQFRGTNFSWTHFYMNPELSMARSRESAEFSRVHFYDGASFSGVHFYERVNFSMARFCASAESYEFAIFSDAYFYREAIFSWAAFQIEPIFGSVPGNEARFSCKVDPENYDFEVSSESPYKIDIWKPKHNGIEFTIPKGAILFDPDEPSK